MTLQPLEKPENAWVCWDSEGADIDGRHELLLVSAFDGERHDDLSSLTGALTTDEIFRFISRQARRNPSANHVIFAGSYDFNMWLRSVPPSNLRELAESEETTWQGWQIKWRPRKFLRVQRGKRKPVTVWDVWGFFQSSFIRAAAQWTDSEELADVIAAGKAQRGSFAPAQLPEITSYCHAELIVLERMMSALRAALEALGLSLTQWHGGSAIASAMLTRHDRPSTRVQPAENVRKAVESAYFGGRFELILPGDHSGPVHAYDINSAYPAAVCELPAIGERNWIECALAGCALGPFDLAHVTWSFPDRKSLPFLPFAHRNSHGGVQHPRRGSGWKWSPEITAARDAGLSEWITMGEHFHFIGDTTAKPFAWVADLFAERLRHKQSGSHLEKPLKIGLNSIYGKFAQQAGWTIERPVMPRHHHLSLAGLVTSMTRAKLFALAMQAPESIIAFETDGLHSREPLIADVGTALGQWSHDVLSRLTYVQSGIYFPGEKSPKYRGFDSPPESMTDADADKFLTRERVLRHWERLMTHVEPDVDAVNAQAAAAIALRVPERNDPCPCGQGKKFKVCHGLRPLPPETSLRFSADMVFPTIGVQSTRFMGLKAALRAAQPLSGWCQWTTAPRLLNIDPLHNDFGSTQKRSKRSGTLGRGQHVVTKPASSPKVSESKPYSVVWEPWLTTAERDLLLERQRDFDPDSEITFSAHA